MDVYYNRYFIIVRVKVIILRQRKLETIEKCRKQTPAAQVFHIFLDVLIFPT